MTLIVYDNGSMCTNPRPGGIIRVDRRGYLESHPSPVSIARPKVEDHLAYNRIGLWLMFAFVMVALVGLFELMP